MKVESIAESSLWSILLYFRPTLSDNWPWKPIFGLFERGRFTQFFFIVLSIDPICFQVQFFYHMYGRVLGRIELWVDDLCGSRRKQIMLWEKEGLKSDQKWHYAEVPITNTSSRQV